MQTNRPALRRIPARDGSDRLMLRLGFVLLAVLALGSGLFGLSHDHSSDDLLGHHCALCHAQPTTLEPVDVAELTLETAPRCRLSVVESGPVAATDARLQPPLRGPPLA